MIKISAKNIDVPGTELLCFKGQITLSETVAVLVPEREMTLEELRLIRIKEECKRQERCERKSRYKMPMKKAEKKRWYDKIAVAMSCMAML